MRCFVIALAALALTSGTFSGEDDCLWDNDLIPDGWNGQGVSPPQLPDIRVADNFVIPAQDKAWVLRGFHAAVIEREGWIPGTLLEVNIYADGGNCPGALIAQVSGRFERIWTGEILYAWKVYEYWISFDDILLASGRYWVGHRNPLGAGERSNFWLTSSGGKGEDTPGCVSLDNGFTWKPAGPGWDFAFKLTGCEPCVGDINGDCVVDFGDILAILAAWGNAGGPEDLDGSGFVDFGDLLIVLSAWGPCE